MAPIVSIIGRSGSGKTTLLEKLIVELKSRGYRIATVKHTPMGMKLAEGTKNSQRHLQAGSEAVVMAGTDQLVLIKPLSHPASLSEAAKLLGDDYDLILTEGFKLADSPKIELHRREVGPPLANLKKLVAIVTDEPLSDNVRQFSPDDIKGIADLLEIGFIQPQRTYTKLYVNGQEIDLSSFPREFVTNVLLAMAHSLKGVDKIDTLQISMKRRHEENNDVRPG